MMNTANILNLVGQYIGIIVITIVGRYVYDKITYRNKDDED